MTAKIQKYKIVRYYHPSVGRKNRIIKRGLTLEQARKHCQSPKTEKKGKYFDGYTKQ